MIFLKTSDFKIISITLNSIIIFFTIYFFRDLPFNLLNININSLNNIFLNIYYLFNILLAIIITGIFILSYKKKSDEELKIRFKSIGIGLLALATYFILPYFEGIPFALFDMNPKNLHTIIKIIYLIIFGILMMSLIMLIYNKKITKDYKDIKKNHSKYFSKYLRYWLACLFVMMVSNLIINLLFTNSIPNNEQAIRDIFNISPFYIFFEAVLFAPIVEELVFRLSIKKIFSHKWVFVLVSGLLFGSMHVFNDFHSLYDLLYIIPYSTPGIAFALMLEDSDNVLVPISFHFLHNGILISLQFMILLFG